MTHVDDSLDILLEEVEDQAPPLGRSRFAWRWVLRAVVGLLACGTVAAGVLVAYPALEKAMGKAGSGRMTALEALRLGTGGGAGAGSDALSHGEAPAGGVAAPADAGAGAVAAPVTGTGAGQAGRWDTMFDDPGAIPPVGPDVVGGEAGIVPFSADAALAPEPGEVIPLAPAMGKCGFEHEEPLPDAAGHRVVHGTLGKFGSMYALLQKNGVDANTLGKVVASLEKVFDPASARAEDSFRLFLDEKTGAFEFLEIRRSDTRIYHVVAFGNGTIDAHKVVVPTEQRWAKAGGAVSGSLYASVVAAGLEGEIVNEFMSVFGAYSKFVTDSREGDTFRVIASGEWLGKEFLGYDPPQIMEYNGQKTGDMIAIYYESSAGEGKYYWPDGTSLERLVAEVPLQSLRITSPFDPKRLHPVLKVLKPHMGTDFAAPTGTPVYAFEAGTVKEFGMKGPAGNMIHLVHGGGIETYYMHLSGFGKGLKKGGTVSRGDLIGYSGNTGRSTGPHLHFGLKKGGTFVDPMKYMDVTTLKEAPIEAALRDGFDKRAKTLLAMLRSIKVPDLPKPVVKKAAAPAPEPKAQPKPKPEKKAKPKTGKPKTGKPKTGKPKTGKAEAG